MRRLIHVFICFGFFYNSVIGQDIMQPVISGQHGEDENGNFINAHDAGILHFGNTYYSSIRLPSRADFNADSKIRTTIRLFSSEDRSCPGSSLPLSTSDKY
jgi:hypothetical protein